MKWSYWEAFLTSCVIGFAESYFAAYSLNLGNSALQSGLLLSLPLVFAGLLQFILQPYFHYMSVTKFVSRAIILQSFSLLGLAFISLSKIENSFAILLLLFSIYWLGHFSLQPAWNRWISEILPAQNGNSYFSIRVRINQIGIILGLLIGGSILHLKVIDIQAKYLFTFLFLFGFLCKLLTYLFFTLHQQLSIPLHLSREKMKSTFLKYFSFFKNYSIFNFTVYISSTFVAGYLLSIKKISYLEFMIIMVGLFLGKMATTYLSEKFKHQIDPSKYMFWGAFVAAPLPALWPFCQSWVTMFILHFISGMAWALWEVGLSITFFKGLESDSKMETISVYNYLGITTQVLGTLFGAFLIKYVFVYNYDLIFILAGIIRLGGAYLLKKTPFGNFETESVVPQTQS